MLRVKNNYSDICKHTFHKKFHTAVYIASKWIASPTYFNKFTTLAYFIDTELWDATTLQ